MTNQPKPQIGDRVSARTHGGAMFGSGIVVGVHKFDHYCRDIKWEIGQNVGRVTPWSAERLTVVDVPFRAVALVTP